MLAELLAFVAGSMAAPDFFTRAVNHVRDNNSEFRTLKKEVRAASGYRLTRAYRRWLISNGTWRTLVQQPEESYDALVSSLVDELKRVRSLPWRPRKTEAQIAEQANAIVDATVHNLIASLAPARAAAAVGERLHHDIRHLEGIITTGRALEDRLDGLPPSTHEVLLRLSNIDSSATASLVLAFENQATPTDAARLLIAHPPQWLGSAPPLSWVVIGHLCLAYDLYEEAACAFGRAGELGVVPGECFVQASLASLEMGNRDAAEAYLARAVELGESDLTRLGQYVISQDLDSLVTVGQSSRPLELLEVAPVVSAMVAHGMRSQAVSILRGTVDRYPKWAGFSILLANILLLEVHDPASLIDKVRARFDARELAIAARDSRRLWGGDSGLPALIACQSLMLSADYETVIQIGCAAPHGDATLAESDYPGVSRLVVEAALAIRNNDQLVGELLGRVTGTLDRQILQAEYDLDRGAPAAHEAAAIAFRNVYRNARDDEDRLIAWMALASIGEDLPDSDRLASRADEYSTTIFAQLDFAQGRQDLALQRLREWQTRSPRVAKLLATLLARRHEYDESVGVCRRSVEQFNDSTFLVWAAEMLHSSGDLQRSGRLASEGLAKFPSGDRHRQSLYRLVVAAAQDGDRWREMERTLRRWIDEFGSSSELRWLLAGALYNQRRLSDSWTVMSVRPALVPESEQQAGMWVELNLLFSPTESLIRTMLEMASSGAYSLDFAARIVARSFTVVSDDSLPVEARTELADFAAAFLREHPDNGVIHTLTISDDLRETSEALRPLLQDGAVAAAEIAEQIADLELPYGILSYKLNRPYTSVLLGRAAGFLPIHAADVAINIEELGAASRGIGEAVVLDISSAVVMADIREMWPVMLANFSAIFIPQVALSDVREALRQSSLPADGTLTWNTETDSFVGYDADHDAELEFNEALRWIEERCCQLSITDWADPSDWANSPFGNIDSSSRLAPWAGPVIEAHRRGLPLVADDVVLRGLARAAGVPSFGSVAMLDAFVRKGQLDGARATLFLDSLRINYCVDLPLDGLSLIRAARAAKWKPRGAAFAFARPALWQTSVHTYGVWRGLAAEAAVTDPSYIAGWVQAALVGCAKGRPDVDVVSYAGQFLLDGIQIAGMDPAVLPALADGVRRVTQQRGLPDPLIPMLRALFAEISAAYDSASAGLTVLNLASQLSETDRTLVRQIVFGA